MRAKHVAGLMTIVMVVAAAGDGWTNTMDHFAHIFAPHPFNILQCGRRMCCTRMRGVYVCPVPSRTHLFIFTSFDKNFFEYVVKIILKRFLPLKRRGSNNNSIENGYRQSLCLAKRHFISYELWGSFSELYRKISVCCCCWCIPVSWPPYAIP